MSNRLIAQNVTHMAFDTNGEIGECLFPENENGEIIFTEIVNCEFSSDTIKALLQEWLYDLEHVRHMGVNDVLVGLTKINFELEIPVGEEYFVIGDAATIKRHKSQVTLLCSIDIRDKKYRYTLSEFYTNRRMIRGEAKSEGPSNLIHWQRINSLNKEVSVLQCRGKKDEEIREYKNLIESEKQSYKAEYQAVCELIKEIKEFTVIKDF